VLVVDDVLVHHRLKRLTLKLLEGLEAKLLQGGPVGIDQLVVEVADRDRLPQGLQQRRELGPATVQEALTQ
jgi:hypothetical protein